MINIITSLNHVAIFLFILRSLTGEVVFLYIGLIIGLIVFCFQFFVYKLNLLIIIYIILFILGSLISLVNDFDTYLLFLPLGISSLGIAWRIHTHGINHRLISILFLLIFAYFIFKVIIINSGIDSAFANSRNHISVMFINMTVLYIISSNIIGKNYNSFPAYVTLYASYLGVGLTGIIASLVLITMKPIDFLYKKISYTIYLLLIASIFLVITFFDQVLESISYILIFNQDIESDYYLKFSNLSEYSSNPRFEIWSEYLSSLNLYKIIFGISIDECFATICNLHSAYFLLHARTGNIALAFILFFITSLIRLGISNIKLAICLFAILLRGVGDTTFMAGSSFDFVIAYLIVFAPYSTEIQSTYKKTYNAKR